MYNTHDILVTSSEERMVYCVIRVKYKSSIELIRGTDFTKNGFKNVLTENE